MRLESNISTVKGVGPSLSEKLATLGIVSVYDLIYFFPRNYEDFSQVIPIAKLIPGKVTIKGRVESVVGRYVRRRMHITEAIVADKTSKVRVVWFNQSYRVTQFSKDEDYYFSGTYDLRRNRYVISNPATEQARRVGVSTARIVPIYRETKGLKSHQIRKILNELIPLMQVLAETLPPQILLDHNLLGINQTLANLHFPESSQLLQQAKDRIAFEELLWLLTASQLNKADNSALRGWRINFDKTHANQFVSALPFKMTNAQRRAAWEILQDFEQPSPMNRLLQGDVGSGKTAVAAFAAFMAAKKGLQTAFMAPTEILAKQHAQALADLLAPMNVTVGLLVGSTKAVAKKLLKQNLKQGKLDIVVGTQALIQGDTEFNKLGFVVIDEQHRFGVRQRAELLARSPKMPHLLSMSATPIPRSLQLTVYGELEISVIDELPKGRQPIKTQLALPQARYQVYQKIDDEIKKGRQVYVVCPIISQLNSELKSVKAEHDRLSKSIFKHRRLGLLHGQMKAADKEEVMQQFKAGSIDILISTTVIEVGVDVPNATVMLIEGAERFGLAQLHQLRGRVGRGANQSYCYLVPSDGNSISQRLKELENSNDGFYLAEADLKLRGPGEIYGRAQHGKLDLNFVNLADVKQIRQVSQAAKWLIASGIDLLQYKQLAKKVEHYRRLTSLN